MNCLYSVVMSSLEWPYVVCVSALRTFRRCLALVLMSVVCGLNVIILSKVTPRILGVLLMGSGVLFSVTCGVMLSSLLYGVMRVSEDLFAETLSLFVLSQSSKEWM